VLEVDKIVRHGQAALAENPDLEDVHSADIAVATGIEESRVALFLNLTMSDSGRGEDLAQRGRGC
jgi:hypothetical protein